MQGLEEFPHVFQKVRMDGEVGVRGMSGILVEGLTADGEIDLGHLFGSCQCCLTLSDAIGSTSAAVLTVHVHGRSHRFVGCL